MTYPFEFQELLLTSKVLDVLGFSEYWGGSGDFGDRALNLGGQIGDPRLIEKKEFPNYYIREIDESEDPCAGYCIETIYGAGHFCNKDFSPIYFLHDMYEDIMNRRTPEEIDKFVEITKKDGVNMHHYIKSYEEWKKLREK